MADGPAPLSDLEIADPVLRGATSGPPGDREPTLAHLLTAFDEPQATPDARRRVAAALKMAGATVTPDLIETPAGDRVRITPPGGGKRSRSAAQKAGAAAAAPAGLIAIAVVASHHEASDPTADRPCA